MTTTSLRHKLMYRSIHERLEAANILHSKLDMSDSAYLLNLLAFELALKLLFELSQHKPAHESHDYANIFRCIEKNTRKRILNNAIRYNPNTALSDDPEIVLTHLADNFVSLRYPYQKYSDMDEQHYHDIGDKWLRNGADVNTAMFRYYPEELHVLTYVIRQEISSYMDGLDSEAT